MSELCFRWETYWPHAVRDIGAIQATHDRAKVTCDACLWALGTQKQCPPR